MYFNQISLLIYPVVSSNALLSLNTVENGNVSALTKINALIQSLVGHDEMTICSSSSSPIKNTTRALNTDKAPDYFSEEELGLFIVNSIIEPLFQDDTNAVAVERAPEKHITGLLACSNVVMEKKCVAEQNGRKNIRETYSLDDEMEANMNDEFQFVTSNVLINDLYNLIGNDLFRMDDKLLSEILSVNPFESLTFSKNNSVDANKSCKQIVNNSCSKTDLSKRIGKDRRKDDGSFRLRYDNYKRPITQRKYQKRNVINFDKKYPFEFVNKKFTEPLTFGKNFIW